MKLLGGHWTWERILNTIGLALLLLAFGTALFRVFARERREADPNIVTIRFAHTHLEGTVREAFDFLAAEYMRRNPGVRVEQMPIPERIYDIWTQTQLVGGTAPDLMHLAGGIDREVLARFFVPLTEHVHSPNPYNAGTALEGLPWRETFIDGLAAPPAFQPRLQEIYGVPNSFFTFRVFYNKELYRAHFGDRPLPTTYEDFVELLADVDALSSGRHGRLLSMAGSRFNAPFLLDFLFKTQTQRLTQELNRSRHLLPDFREQILAFLAGEWSLRSPDVLSGLELMAEVGRFMPAGFMQMGREDAMFFFAQGRALMMVSGSWDAESIRMQTTFPVGVLDLPAPLPDDPRFETFTLGRPSEGTTFAAAAFGLVRLSRNPEVAIDFLRFLTSAEANAGLARRASWIPAIVGVEPAPAMVPFLPYTGGFVPGFDLNFGPDTRRILQTRQHMLFDPEEGAVDRFIDRIESDYADAIRHELNRILVGARRNAAELDVSAIAWFFLSGEDVAAPARERYSAIMETQSAIEWLNYWTRLEVDWMQSRPE